MIDALSQQLFPQISMYMEKFLIWNLYLGLMLIVLMACRWSLYRLKASAHTVFRLWLIIPAFMVLSLILPGLSNPGGLNGPQALSGVLLTSIQQLETLVINASDSASINWIIVGFCIWLSVSLLLLGLLIRNYHLTVKSLQLTETDALPHCHSSQIQSPVCVGIIKPRVVLNDRFKQQFTSQQQGFLLHHETIHQRRRDPLWRLFAELCRLLCWFNPLVHIASRLFARDQEISCDEKVLACTDQSQRLSYARLLSSLATESHINKSLVCTSGSTLKERIMRIAYLNQQPNTRRSLAALGIFMLLSSVAFGAQLATQLPILTLSAQAEVNSSSQKQEKLEKQLIQLKQKQEMNQAREKEYQQLNKTLKKEERELSKQLATLKQQRQQLSKQHQHAEQQREQMELKRDQLEKKRKDHEIAAQSQLRQAEEKTHSEAKRDYAKQTGSMFQILSRTSPKYPRQAALEGVEGYVDISFELQPDGSITNIHIKNSAPDSVFDKVAIEAVSQWEMINHLDDAITMNERIEFRMD